MAFNNGFPNEDSIKLPLYSIEPEQLSDLVAVPFCNNPPWKVKLITNDRIPTNRLEESIQNISFPISNYPCLFQRYNPDGLSFANEYSKKLYQWRKKYSRSILLDLVPTLKAKLNDVESVQQNVSFNIGNTLKVKLPNTQDKIIISYYYPELNPEELYISTLSGENRLVEPEEISNWRHIEVSPNKKPFSLTEFYEYRRIDNDCIGCETSRSFLLRFETYFCKGQEIEIDEDCLISSLVIDYGELNTEDTEFINDQIPECYFYSYIDTFFSTLDEAIENSLGQPFNIYQPTEIKFSLSVSYDFLHKQNSTEYIRNTGKVYYNGALEKDDDVLLYGLNTDNIYRLSGECSNVIEKEYLNYQVVSNKLEFGALIYANNNYWNNYNFNLEDEGFIEVVIIRNNRLVKSGNKIEFEYLGAYYLKSSGFKNAYPPFGIIYGDDYRGYRNDFIKKSITHSGSLQTDFLAMVKDFNKDSVYIWNNYFNYLLYDQIIDIPDYKVNLTNTIEGIASTVNNASYREGENYPYFIVKTAKKVFQLKIDKILTSCSYANSLFGQRLENLSEQVVNEAEIVGQVNCTFDKYGESHPTAKKYRPSDNGGTYVPVKYFEGRPTSTPIEGELEYVYQSEAVFDDLILNSSEPNFVEGFPTHVLLNKYSLDSETNFEESGTLTIEHTTQLVKTSTFKPLRPIYTYPRHLQTIKEAHENCYMANIDLEEIKKQVREIHLALDAQKFAYEDTSEEVSRIANLGYYIERIARILGISVNSDGSIRSIRQSTRIESGNTIPEGWNLGQWGRNNGGSTRGQRGGNNDDEKDGIAWEIRSNQFKNDDFTGETNAVEQGGYALVENLPQLLHIIFDDLDRAFGLQNAGANVLPTPNGDRIASYQGMNSMLLDLLYTLGQISRQTTGSHVLAMKNQAILQEILSGFGLPVTIKEAEISAGEDIKGVIPYPGFAPNAPTVNDLHTLTLINLATLLGSNLQIPEEEEEQEEEQQEEENN